nr:MAG TPA: hypothetical protein [Caudoviricetes sp.]
MFKNLGLIIFARTCPSFPDNIFPLIHKSILNLQKSY